MRDLAKLFFWAGFFLVAVAVSGAQAAVVTDYREGNTATVGGGVAAWTAAAGLIGTIQTETFGTDVSNPPNTSAAVSFGTITFGDSPGNGNASGPPLLGSIASNTYHDRADDNATTKPVFHFDGPGVKAFGAHFDLGPNTPGTGIKLHLTFTDNSEADVVTKILNVDESTGFVGFFGIVSDMAIREIRFDEGGQFPLTKDFETFDMTNVQFVSAVPVPAALPLFLSAIAALGFFGRRRIRGATA